METSTKWVIGGLVAVAGVMYFWPKNALAVTVTPAKSIPGVPDLPPVKSYTDWQTVQSSKAVDAINVATGAARRFNAGDGITFSLTENLAAAAKLGNDFGSIVYAGASGNEGVPPGTASRYYSKVSL